MDRIGRREAVEIELKMGGEIVGFIHILRDGVYLDLNINRFREDIYQADGFIGGVWMMMSP